MSHLMSAQRGNFHLAGHLRTCGRTPHFLEIWEKCENPLQTPHLQSERRDAVTHPVTNWGDDNDLLRLDVQAL